MKNDFLADELKTEIRSLKKQRKILAKLIAETQRKVSQTIGSASPSRRSDLFFPWYWVRRHQNSKLNPKTIKKTLHQYKNKASEIDQKILENEFFLKFMSY